MKLLITVLLLSGISLAEEKKEVKADNPLDRVECRWEKDQTTIAASLGNSKKGHDPSACKGEKEPMSKRLDKSLKKDAKKLKSFFGIGD